MSKRLGVLVTRPSPLGEALCDELKKHAYAPLFLPVIEIKPLITPEFQKQIEQLDEIDVAIFLSRHAVRTSCASIQEVWPQFPESVTVIAIGEGTAEALREVGLPSPLCPSEWSSEGLLAMPELQHVKDKRIALFCGKDGRETLAQELEKRGAEVLSVVSYERCLPQVEIKPFYRLLQEHKIDAVVCTSGQSILFLKQLFSKPHIFELLSKIPLVLVSERIMILAREQGFENCVLAANASHEGILQALEKIRNESMSVPPKTPDHFTVHHSSTKSSGLSWGFGVGISVLLLASLIAALFFGQNFQASLSAAHKELESNRAQLATLQDKVSDMEKDLQAQRDTLEQQKNRANNPSPYLSNILAAAHWVDLASENLLLTANFPQTINFLIQAQNELEKVTSPDVLALKQALVEDIAALKAMAWVNPADLYLKVIALQKTILELPINLVPVPETQAPQAPLIQSGNFWQQGLHDSWQILRQMVVVHRLPKANTPPFIMPDQHPFIYQNVYAILNETLWAVLHQDADIYHASLKQAEEWINQYFQVTLQSRNVLNEIAALQTVSAQSAKGITLAAPKAFQDYLKNS